MAWVSDGEHDFEDAAAAAIHVGLACSRDCGIIALAQAIQKWLQVQSSFQLKVQAHRSELQAEGRFSLEKPDFNEEAVHFQAGRWFASYRHGHLNNLDSAICIIW